MKKIIKSYQFELQPTKEQIELIVQSVGCIRFTWNYFLHENKINYIKYIENIIATKPSVNYEEMANYLVILKKTGCLFFFKTCPFSILTANFKKFS